VVQDDGVILASAIERREAAQMGAATEASQRV
jgi:hypothetical protein